LYVQNGPAPRPPVIVMSCRPESESAALAAGAEGFVSKADPPGALLAALRRWVRERAPVEGEVASARDVA
jgi:CheY-like chemotaxis protein